MNLGRDAVLSRAKNTTYEVVDDEAILIHLDSGNYYSLNRTGTEFWQMLDGRASLADHAWTIADSYGVEREVVVADLIELANELADYDLITAI